MGRQRNMHGPATHSFTGHPYWKIIPQPIGRPFIPLISSTLAKSNPPPYIVASFVISRYMRQNHRPHYMLVPVVLGLAGMLFMTSCKKSDTPATGLQVLSFSPARAGVGANLVINGANFGSSPADN